MKLNMIYKARLGSALVTHLLGLTGFVFAMLVVGAAVIINLLMDGEHE